MVPLTMTSKMVIAIKYLQTSGQTTKMEKEDADPSMHAPKIGNPISHEQVLQLAKTLSGLKSRIENELRQEIPPHSLNELLRGSRVYVEPPKPKAEPVGTSHFL